LSPRASSCRAARSSSTACSICDTCPDHDFPMTPNTHTNPTDPATPTMKERTTMNTHRLSVPGAELHYEVRGDGPLVLCIPGAPADAATFDGLAELLAEEQTVVAYDQ